MSSDRWRNSFEKQVSKALIERINFTKREIKKVTPGSERTWSYYLLLSSLRKNDPTMSSNTTFSARATFFLPCLSLSFPISLIFFLSCKDVSPLEQGILRKDQPYCICLFTDFQAVFRNVRQMLPLLKCMIHVLISFISFCFRVTSNFEREFNLHDAILKSFIHI